MNQQQQQASQTIDHLFRHEYGRIVAVLCRIFGFDNIQIAEDIVQDSLISAMENWRYGQLPDNPKAWLYRVAKNKALDFLRSKRIHEGHHSQLSAIYQSEYTLSPAMDQLFLDYEIKDSQLRMLFAICHPAIPLESQLALALQTISGFSVDEIARAFLSNKETITKRLYRAKDRIKKLKLSMEVPVKEEIPERLNAVLTCIYLMLNKSYDFVPKEKKLNEDLCLETARLCKLLSQHPLTQSPKTHALMALICFQASRFNARINEQGMLIPYEEQDSSKWNTELIKEGFNALTLAASGEELSTYHLEAAIAAQYCMPVDPQTVNWEAILSIYDLLIQLKNTPVTQMNRAIVLSKVKGPETALESIQKIEGLDDHYLYHATLGSLYLKLEQSQHALIHFKQALALCQSETEKEYLRSCIQPLE